MGLALFGQYDAEAERLDKTTLPTRQVAPDHWRPVELLSLVLDNHRWTAFCFHLVGVFEM